jgi:hypothetical protein
MGGEMNCRRGEIVVYFLEFALMVVVVAWPIPWELFGEKEVSWVELVVLSWACLRALNAVGECLKVQDLTLIVAVLFCEIHECSIVEALRRNR